MLDIHIANEPVQLPQIGSWPEAVHVFDETSIWAINAALNAQRPLLIRGKPGTGKSQLARAAAHKLNRLFISEVVHSKSDVNDLLWQFDAVGRLGDAQMLSASSASGVCCGQLDYSKYISPGPLWWVFDWDGADKQLSDCKHKTRKPIKPKNWQPEKGSVLLIDEIDKADADLPNGLLETLGNGAFTVPYLDNPIGRTKNTEIPLVIITTNEERELPVAFVRRCLVLHLSLPKEDDKLKGWLVDRAKCHFPSECDDKILGEAADLLIEDRKQAAQKGISEPGQAEYLDLIRALTKFGTTYDQQHEALNKISMFTFKKSDGDMI